MIKMTVTQNIAGITICGDYQELYDLVNAFHDLFPEEPNAKEVPYYDIYERLLGICYDIRHAYQGDRSITTKDNGVNDELMKLHRSFLPNKNVYFECNCLMTEMIFAFKAIDTLVSQLARRLSGKRSWTEAYLHPKVMYNPTVITLRAFQAAFISCMEEALAESSFKRWHKLIVGESTDLKVFTLQFLDFTNSDYLSWSKETRLKKLISVTKSITQFYDDEKHIEIAKMVKIAAKEYDCSEIDIEFKNLLFPDEIEW